MKNPFANYSKDTMAKVTVVCLFIGLCLFTWAAPDYWYIDVIAAIFYVWLFWVERNNP